MKKKLLFVAAVLGSFSMLCGFDSAETADSVYNKMSEAQKGIENMAMDLSFNFDGTASITDGETTTPINAAAKGNFSADYTLSPFAMKMDGTINVGLPLLGMDETITEKAYLVTSDTGALKSYIYTEDSVSGDSGWMVQEMTDIDVNALIETAMASSLSYADMAEWGVSFALAPEAADVNGVECYLLSTTLDSTSFGTMLSKVTELLGSQMPAADELSQVVALLDGLKLNLAYYVDCETYLPVGIHFDMNDSDLSIINMLISSYLGSFTSEDAAPSSVEITLNDSSIDAAASFGGVSEITVPDEALQAEASGNVISMDDVAGAIAQ